MIKLRLKIICVLTILYMTYKYTFAMKRNSTIGQGFPQVRYVVWFGFMVFNATFNNISVISWRSVLLVEETGVPGENH